MFGIARYLCLCVFFLALIPSCIASRLQAPPQPFPIDFEANQGQAPSEYPYIFHRDGLLAMFQHNGVDFALAGRDDRDKLIHLTFLGTHAKLDALQPIAAHSNYFLGRDPSQWIRNVPLYSRIEYSALYRGISLGFYGNGQELEHDFYVDPGSDPSQIAFRLSGASRIQLSAAGDIEIESAHGVLTLRKPVAYQMLNGKRRDVDAKFLLSSDNTVRFAIGAYDARQSLVIDPVYVFSTYLGGSTGADNAAAVTTDANGNILVVGSTSSTDFPTSNALQPSLGNNNQSVFVSKFDPTGKTLIYSTYLGGSSQDLGAPNATGGAIAVDAAGDAIIAGLASSSNFPHAGAIVSPSCVINAGCFFVASLKPDGSALNYAGLIGGQQGNYTFGLGGDLAVDASGNAYLAGVTDNSNFQITAGTLATSVVGDGYDETFVLKVDPTGKLLYSTVIPGNDTNSNDLVQPSTNNFMPSGIAVDSSGDVTIAGTSGLGLPTTSGVVSPQFPNAYVNVEDPVAGFVLQLNPTASAINFASYLPGTDYERGLAVDAKGNLYLTGGTVETNLPVSSNAYQKAPVTISDGQIVGAYVMVLNPQATGIVGATYLGAGAMVSYGFSAIALDSHDNIFVGGNADEQDYPLLNPFVTEYEVSTTGGDMVLAELSPSLSSLEFSTYLSSVDFLGASLFSGIAVDKTDHLVAIGTTSSRDFPTTPGSFEPQLPSTTSNAIYQHSFVTKIDLSTPAPAVCFSSFSVSFGNVNVNGSGSQTLDITNCGNASLNISSIASSDATVTADGNCSAIASGSVCPVTLTFTPVSVNATSGTITLTDNAQTIPQTVSFTGQGTNPAPTIASFSPNSANVGGTTFTLTVNGTGFVSTSVARWNNTPLSTTYVSAQQLTASVPAADIASVGYAAVSVFNPAPGGGSSVGYPLAIVSPLSTTTSLSIAPSGGILAAGSSYTLTATVSATSGAKTPTGSIVFAIGSASQTAVLDSSGTATYMGISPAAGSLSISAAYQGAPGFLVSTSSTLNETVTAADNPVPAVLGLSPAFTAAGASNFTLTVSGSSFVSSSTVYWGTTALTTQFVSATQLTAQVTASEIAAAGVTEITVQSSGPGGGTSNSRQFEVDSASSGSGASFTTLTATVTPGSAATYPVTLPSSATNVSVACLNLPSGATCTYSSASRAVTIATSATTPAGTYQITVVFTETLPGTAMALVFLPIFLLPLLIFRRKWTAHQVGFMAFLALALVLTATTGCESGSSSGSGQTQSQTHAATSSGVVTLIVQ